MSTVEEIKKLENQRSVILEEIINIRHMIRGSYGKVYRKCGKETCWCNKEKKGHPIYRITWTKKAKPGTKAIPKEDIAWIKEMTGNYKRCRTLRTYLRNYDKDLRLLLDKLENEIITRTEKLRNYFFKH